MSEIDDLVNKIKESVFDYIKTHNGECDMVDVVCQFKKYTCDIPSLAIHELIEEGGIEYRETVWNIQPYRLFVRE